MDYRTITNTSSRQYQFIKANMNVGENGLLYTDDQYIGVALGSYYGDIGDKFVLTFEDGREVKVIKIDAKADIHTIDGCYQYLDGSMIELVIDTERALESFQQAMLMGDFNYSDLFNGSIVSVHKMV